MKLEPINIICPKCGNANYMRHLAGENVGKLDIKCINCNSYFSFNELYNQKIAEVIKPKTNADRIRAMTDEELAEFCGREIDGCAPRSVCPPHDSYDLPDCKQCWLDWIKQECDS